MRSGIYETKYETTTFEDMNQPPSTTYNSRLHHITSQLLMSHHQTFLTSRKLMSKRSLPDLNGKRWIGRDSFLRTRVVNGNEKRTERVTFLVLVCIYVISTISVFSFVTPLSSSEYRYFFEKLLRKTHHTNAEIETLKTLFPIQVGDEFETIEHPGFSLADQQRLNIIFSGMKLPKTLEVPRFWNPSYYGEGGVREFLGERGKRLISPEEAMSVGSLYEGRETIFIAVTSYRDPECLPTVEDIYMRSKHPERIRVAIVDQRVEGDNSCTTPTVPCEHEPDQVLCRYGHLIDVIEVPAQYMVGPVFARHIAYRMYRGEYFAMQVDSHVRFVHHWDEDLIGQFKSTNNEMAVISTYLSDITGSIDPYTHKSLRLSRSIMCKAEYEWNGDSKAHIKNGIQPTNMPRIDDTPMLDPFWAAGFSFARGHFVVQVPYDQYLPMVFQGEEISMTIRGFTYGYDFYAPVRNVAFHIYAVRANVESRNKVSKFTENEVMFPGAKDKAYDRLNGIIGTGPPGRDYYRGQEDEFGLGQVRDKETFFRTFGIQTKTQRIEEGLCDFVQGKFHDSMHEKFSPNLRYDGMGIDYRRIDFEYAEADRKETLPDDEELNKLREMLRKRVLL